MRHWQLGLKAILLAGAATSCPLWQPAIAQTAGQQSAQVGGGDRIEEVIVTARKREENVQKVPISVSVQSGEFLQQHQVTDLYGLASLDPSLQVQSELANVGQPAFAIRGIGTALAGSTIESSVGVVVDDIPMARMQLANISLFDINNTQVLKGPQGMLFGKNAAAGLINIVTNNPEFDETNLMAHAQYGAMNTPSAGNSATVDIGANIPISEQAALRVVGFFTHYDAFTKNVFNPNQFLGENMGGGRAKFLWEPRSDLRVLLAADYVDENGPGEGVQTHSYDSPLAGHFGRFAACVAGGGTPLACAPAGAPGPGILASFDAAAGITPSRRNLLINSGGSNADHYQTYGYSAKIEYDVGGGFTVTDITGYRGYAERSIADLTATPLNFDDSPSNSHYWQVTQELRLTSPSDQRFTYQGGIFFQHLTADFDVPSCPTCTQLGFMTPPGHDAVVNDAQNYLYASRTLAGYFEGVFKILDSLRLTAGGRYTHDSFDYSAIITPDPHALLTFYGPTHNQSTLEKYNLSGRTSLEYDVTDDVMAYVSAARGYKGPAFNQISLGQNAATPIGPEIPEDYEIGVKSEFLDHRLRLNVDGFDETFYGYQVQVQTVTNGVIFAQDTNAGALKTRGAEVELTALPYEGLTLNGGLTYNDATYSNLKTLPCYAAEPVGTGVNQCNIPAGFPPITALGTTNLNGNQLALASKWTETFTARFEQPVLDAWNGFIQGSGTIRSPYNFSPSRDPNTQIGSTAVFNLNIGAESDDGRYSVSLFVNNLTDQRIPVYMISAPAGNLVGAYACGAPAVVFLGLCGDGRTPGTGDYTQQFGASSFRTVGITLDYRD